MNDGLRTKDDGKKKEEELAYFQVAKSGGSIKSSTWARMPEGVQTDARRVKRKGNCSGSGSFAIYGWLYR
jgi:hypothetical protein